MSTLPPGRLAALLTHRWALPVLVEIHRARGARFTPLVNRLGVGRDSLRRTLDALDTGGWVLRNPGYGHPMRPEYLLTPDGERLAPWAARVLRTLRSLGAEEVALRKWSLPVVLALLPGRRRFNELAAALPGVSPRALALALKALEEGGLLERSVEPSHPPRVSYRLSRRGLRLAPAVRALSGAG